MCGYDSQRGGWLLESAGVDLPVSRFGRRSSNNRRGAETLRETRRGKTFLYLRYNSSVSTNVANPVRTGRADVLNPDSRVDSRLGVSALAFAAVFRIIDDPLRSLSAGKARRNASRIHSHQNLRT